MTAATKGRHTAYSSKAATPGTVGRQGVHGDGAGLRTVLLELNNQHDDSFAAWVVTAVTELIDRLKVVITDGSTPVAVILRFPHQETAEQHAAAEAAWQAARGVVHALTREFHAAPPINLVGAGGDPGDEAALASTLEFLASGPAGFVVGASIDLRRSSGPGAAPAGGISECEP